MRAFLSHSSVDKAIVVDVQSGLEPDATWLDRSEIEWGELFLERIAEGIKSATDFVLFWSKSASKSEWVRIEVNMAFIQALRRKAIRLRVVVLDETPLPLYLEPFHVFSVTGVTSPATKILEKLRPLLREPVGSVRSKFVNRRPEIERIEAAIDDSRSRGVLAFGFTGIGKASVVEEALRHLFEGANVVRIDVNSGTGFVELALALSAAVRHQLLPESLDTAQLIEEIRLCIEMLLKNRQLLLFSNIQHWLDEEGEPQGPLLSVLTIVNDLPSLAGRPVFFTSTRRPTLDAEISEHFTIFRVAGLKDEHVAALVRNSYFAIYGEELSVEDSNRIAPKLYGHPVAAHLVAGLLGTRGVDFLEQYPRELVALRRDLARILIRDLKLSPVAERLMETLALAGVGLPAPLIVSSGFSEDDFQQAVAQCASAGLIVAESTIETHPLFQEFYWHRLHRGDYRARSIGLAESTKDFLEALDKSSPEYAALLQVAFRSYALAGEIAKAEALRRDLSGELAATAITLYNRRDYELSDQYISHVLEVDPNNWRMRLYRGRLRVRQEQWEAANQIFTKMLEERPRDVGVMHAMGWSQLRQRNWKKALDIFTSIIAKRDHVRSLRDAAECLYRLNRNDEALKFIERAKERESENAYVLDLESRILEDLGKLDAAFDSAELASARDPLNDRLHNRLGVIRMKQGLPHFAIDHFRRALELDDDQFSPANSLAAAYLDIDEWEEAEGLLDDLERKARTPSNFSLLAHTKARIALAKGDPDSAKELLKTEIAASRNVIPNLGLLVHVHCALFDVNRPNFPAIAAVELKEAEDALQRISVLDPSNPFIDSLRRSINDRKPKPR